MTIWSMIFGRRPRPSPLKIELQNLYLKVAQTDQHLFELERGFWKNGGICCPGCGVPGYRDLCEKQERRLLRISGIEAKLKCDEAKK